MQLALGARDEVLLDKEHPGTPLLSRSLLFARRMGPFHTGLTYPLRHCGTSSLSSASSACAPKSYPGPCHDYPPALVSTQIRAFHRQPLAGSCDLGIALPVDLGTLPQHC